MGRKFDLKCSRRHYPQFCFNKWFRCPQFYSNNSIYVFRRRNRSLDASSCSSFPPERPSFIHSWELPQGMGEVLFLAEEHRFYTRSSANIHPIARTSMAWIKAFSRLVTTKSRLRRHGHGRGKKTPSIGKICVNFVSKETKRAPKASLTCDVTCRPESKRCLPWELKREGWCCGAQTVQIHKTTPQQNGTNTQDEDKDGLMDCTSACRVV